MDHKSQFHNNPHINPKTGRTIVIGGTTYKKLVKEFGLPTISNAILPQIEEIDLNIILNIDDITTLKSLYCCHKSRFANIMNTPYVLQALMKKFDVENVTSFVQLAKIVRNRAPPKFGVGEPIGDCQYPDPDNKLPKHLRWDSDGKNRWLSMLKYLQLKATAVGPMNGRKILYREMSYRIRHTFSPAGYYFDIWDKLDEWSYNDVYAIEEDYMTPTKEFYELINNIYKFDKV